MPERLYRLVGQVLKLTTMPKPHTFTFPYRQGLITLQVTATATDKHGYTVTDIDTVMYNGMDVYALLEAFDQLGDIEAEAARMGDAQFVFSTETEDY